MPYINQNGDEISERSLFKIWTDPATDTERDTTIRLILEHLQLEAIETNATKHGNVEIVLRSTREVPGWKFLKEVQSRLVLYQLWFYIDEETGKEIWQVTRDNNPPTNDAGYHDLQALYQLKGILD